MISFKEFCEKLVTDTALIDPPTGEVYIDAKFKNPIAVLVKNMRSKKYIFDRINVSYIEETFNNRTWEETLEKKVPDGEIPDGVIFELSSGIFGTNPSALEKWQQAIIKVLAVYICIQN